MTIIKAADLDGHIGIHGLALTGSPRRTTPVAVADPLQRELEAARQEAEMLSVRLAETEAELSGLRRTLPESLAASRGEGHAAGVAEAATSEAERLDALKQSLAEACAGVATHLQALEPLALLIAREGLQKILGDEQAYPELIERIVRRQLAGLHAHGVLAVEVSGQDYPDPEALHQLGANLPMAVAVEVNEALLGGECRLRLKLGLLDIGVRRQWEALGQLLGQWAEQESA